MHHFFAIKSNQMLANRALIQSGHSFTQDGDKFQHLFICFIGQQICDLHICQALHINWGPSKRTRYPLQQSVVTRRAATTESRDVHVLTP